MWVGYFIDEIVTFHANDIKMTSVTRQKPRVWVLFDQRRKVTVSWSRMSTDSQSLVHGLSPSLWSTIVKFVFFPIYIWPQKTARLVDRLWVTVLTTGAVWMFAPCKSVDSSTSQRRRYLDASLLPKLCIGPGLTVWELLCHSWFKSTIQLALIQVVVEPSERLVTYYLPAPCAPPTLHLSCSVSPNPTPFLSHSRLLCYHPPVYSAPAPSPPPLPNISTPFSLHPTPPFDNPTPWQPHPWQPHSLTTPPFDNPNPWQPQPLTTPTFWQPHPLDNPTPWQPHPLTAPPLSNPTPWQPPPLDKPHPLTSPTPLTAHPLTTPPLHNPTPWQLHALTTPITWQPHALTTPTPRQPHALTTTIPWQPHSLTTPPLTTPPLDNPTSGQPDALTTPPWQPYPLTTPTPWNPHPLTTPTPWQPHPLTTPPHDFNYPAHSFPSSL